MRRNKCVICQYVIKDWRKCTITIQTVGKWTKRKLNYYDTHLCPVCYNCVERMNFKLQEERE